MVIEALQDVTPVWLTSVLARSGALDEGSVLEVEVTDLQERELSTGARLRLSYSAGSRGTRPERLFLKIVSTEFDNDEPLLPSEVDYYRRDYRGAPRVPIVRCYDAALAEDSRRYHLLLDDVSSTHVQAFEKPLRLGHGLALADGLAAMHAHWWGEARLRQGGMPIPSPAAIERFVEISRGGVGYIMDCCRDELAAHWPETILDLYAYHTQVLVRRTRDSRGFTLIHGDAGPGNILVPLQGDRPVYVIDRAPFEWSLTTWLGVYDLAYALVTGLGIDLRRELEEPLLRRYHAGLLEGGIEDYPWEQLHRDYRMAAAMGVYIATEWCRGSGRQHKDIWMPMLKQALTAVDDLECREFWPSA